MNGSPQPVRHQAFDIQTIPISASGMSQFIKSVKGGSQQASIRSLAYRHSAYKDRGFSLWGGLLTQAVCDKWDPILCFFFFSSVVLRGPELRLHIYGSWGGEGMQGEGRGQAVSQEYFWLTFLFIYFFGRIYPQIFRKWSIIRGLHLRGILILSFTIHGIHDAAALHSFNRTPAVWDWFLFSR